MIRNSFDFQFAPPLSFSEKGKRGKNEDTIFPSSTTRTGNDQLLMVCDGVGGNQKGEVASQLACEAFPEYFRKHESVPVNQVFIEDALKFVQARFDDYLSLNPEAKGMATTLVLLAVQSSGCYVAHCGDSRCYHIRKNQILFKTEDHTTLNELVRNGIISPEEAEKSPKSNRITRAIQGNSVRKVKVDIHQITDIQPDDYFFLCSDGVWSCFSDNDLTEIFSSNHTDFEKLETIRYLCEANSDDNFSAILLKSIAVRTDSELEKTQTKSNLFKKIIRLFR